MKLKAKTIYVYQYKGYSGNWARSRELLWRCTIVGANGEFMYGGDWMSEGIGYLTKSYADDDAARWTKFLGWPVVELGRAELFDSPPRD